MLQFKKNHRMILKREETKKQMWSNQISSLQKNINLTNLGRLRQTERNMGNQNVNLKLVYADFIAGNSPKT